MAVTMRLVFGAVAHQRDGRLAGDLLKQTQGEYLAVVFYGAILPVNCPALKQFFAIAPAEIAPIDAACEHVPLQLLAWAEVRHPDVVSESCHAPAAKPGCQNSQPIRARLD